MAAGTINTVVGSGTLITFPALLAFGYPPVLANVTSNVGLVPGVVSGVYGYRAEVAGQRVGLRRPSRRDLAARPASGRVQDDRPRAHRDRARDGGQPAAAGRVGGRAAARQG